MTYNRDIHHRRSIRLPDYDYSRAGAYFVTMCTFQRECLFGEVVGDAVICNEAGIIVAGVWERLRERFANVLSDGFVVMPNHFHGILILDDHVGAGLALPDGTEAGVGAGLALPGGTEAGVGAGLALPGGTEAGVGAGLALPGGTEAGAASSAPTLGDLMRVFKSMSAISVNRVLHRQGTPLWQRNYYERVIRDEVEFNAIRQYIVDNPLRWSEDDNHPMHFD